MLPSKTHALVGRRTICRFALHYLSAPGTVSGNQARLAPTEPPKCCCNYRPCPARWAPGQCPWPCRSGLGHCLYLSSPLRPFLLRKPAGIGTQSGIQTQAIFRHIPFQETAPCGGTYMVRTFSQKQRRHECPEWPSRRPH